MFLRSNRIIDTTAKRAKTQAIPRYSVGLSRGFYPALIGLQVRSGARQSIPSINMASCAEDSDTVPLGPTILGQTSQNRTLRHRRCGWRLILCLASRRNLRRDPNRHEPCSRRVGAGGTADCGRPHTAAPPPRPRARQPRRPAEPSPPKTTLVISGITLRGCDRPSASLYVGGSGPSR